MKTLQSIALAAHIACGTLAFMTGLIAIVAPKGKKIHTQSGIVYVWSMVGVALTALFMSFMKPELINFFVPLSFFTLQLTLSGWRALARKNIRLGTATPIPRVDWTIAILSLCSGIVFVGLGLMRYLGGNGMGMVSVVFGVIGVMRAAKDIQRFRVIESGLHNEKMEWFFAHLASMLGAYIATITAVLVVNVHFLPPLVVWLGPTVVGFSAITVWRIYYTRKFGLHKQKVVSQGRHQTPSQTPSQTHSFSSTL